MITSPNYPSNYNNNDYCTWEIKVPVNKKVRLDFEDFKTESGKDFLMVYDTGKPFSTIYFDGSTYLPGSFTSSGNSLRIRFISDGQNTLAGFKVKYRQIGKCYIAHDPFKGPCASVNLHLFCFANDHVEMCFLIGSKAKAKSKILGCT